MVELGLNPLSKYLKSRHFEEIVLIDLNIALVCELEVISLKMTLGVPDFRILPLVVDHLLY